MKTTTAKQNKTKKFPGAFAISALVAKDTANSHLPRRPTKTSWQVSGSTMGTLVAAQTLTWPNSHVYMPPKSTAAKARLVSVVGTVDHSDILQSLDILGQSWRFYPQLVQVPGEISVPLPQSHRLWGSALILAPPLHVGHPQASAPHQVKRG